MIFQYFKYLIFKSKHTGKYHTNNTIKILLLLLSVNLGSSSFGVISFCLFILFIGFRECSSHSKHLIPTAQEKNLHMDITRWSILISDWLYSLQPKMEKLYTVSKNKTGSWLWLRSWNTYCQIQTKTEESRENHYTILVWPKSNPLQLYSGNDK